MLSNRSCSSLTFALLILLVVLVYPTMSRNITVRVSDAIVFVMRIGSRCLFITVTVL